MDNIPVLRIRDEKGNEIPIPAIRGPKGDPGKDGLTPKPKAGFIYPLATGEVPEGFLLCDGAVYSRTEYPELFAAIGTIYGEGDGKTTFNVPDLQTRVPVGAGGSYALGAAGGEAEHVLGVDEMPRHGHFVKHSTDNNGIELHWTNNLDTTTGGTKALYIDYFSDGDAGPIIESAESGGGQQHNNMQPYTVVNYVIATGKDTAISIANIVAGAQVIPLEVQYGGTGATNPVQACENLGAFPSAGGEMKGPVNMNGKKLFGIGDPIEDGDAVPKKYVDQALACRIYVANGDIVCSDGGTIAGAGTATVIVEPTGLARIDFGFKILKNGTVEDLYAWGLNRDMLQLCNPDIPKITPLPGGVLIVHNATGTVDSFKNGLGGTTADLGQFWVPSRIYTQDGEKGLWPELAFTKDMLITGTCYGTVKTVISKEI